MPLRIGFEAYLPARGKEPDFPPLRNARRGRIVPEEPTVMYAEGSSHAATAFTVVCPEALDTHRRWFAWLILVTTIGLFGCHATSLTGAKDSKTDVKGTVTKLNRAEDGSFRYYGQVRLQAPSRYRNKEVGLFIISHARDAREFIGKTISASFSDEDLTRAIEPSQYPFSVSSPEPQLSLELVGETFCPIDCSRYVQPVPVRGFVRAYQLEKDKDGMYFMFDVAYSGDWASIEVVEPVKYRGLIIHVIVYESRRVGAPRRTGWSRIGTKVGFTVSESVLAWEPWGFVPIDQLDKVKIESESTPTTRRDGSGESPN